MPLIQLLFGRCSFKTTQTLKSIRNAAATNNVSGHHLFLVDVELCCRADGDGDSGLSGDTVAAVDSVTALRPLLFFRSVDNGLEGRSDLNAVT